jgi:hypothetical protein
LARHASVNKFWLEDEKLSGLGAGFFSFEMNKAQTRPSDWIELRNRWEYSHVARAGFTLLSLIALVIAVSCSK